MAKKRIVLRPIAADEPGYLRQLRKIGYMRRAITRGGTDQEIDEAVEYILEFVTSPEDKEEARALLLDASLNEFLTMFNAVGGADTDPLSESASG